MARVLLGVSGGIAAYKALELVRLMTEAGHAVRTVQTATSLRFVGRASFEALTGAPSLVDEFERDPARGAYPGEAAPARAPISHLALAQRADAMLIAPASANTLAKLAGGHADNLLTSAALAAPCPVAVAPAMNERMLEHPATRANIATLRERGVTVIDPGHGRLASHGEHGAGRLAEPAELLAALGRLLGARAAGGAWDGLRVLVSAGGTREPIDAVRYVGNRSSGRMGVALAEAAAARGAAVTLVAANVALAPPAGVQTIEVGTAAELARACEQEFERCDVLLMAAAVADFRPAAAVAGKIRKGEGAPRAIELEPTADVLSGLAARRAPRQTLVGFAAEHGDRALAHGRSKLAAKGVDAIVVNDVGQPGIGFDSAENAVTILSARGERAVQRAGKDRIAAAVLDEIERLRADRSADSNERERDGASGRAAPGSTARV